jgi:uncharacterized RDD family membrane protein YckC
VATSDGVPPQQARYFWRRLIAYGLDIVVAWVIAALLLAALATDDFDDAFVSEDGRKSSDVSFSFQTASFRPPLVYTTTRCGKFTGLETEIASTVAPATVTEMQLCILRLYGIPNAVWADVTLDDTAAAGELAGKTVLVPLEIKNGFRFADVLAFGLFFAISVASLWLIRTTPGKWMMGLRVQGAPRIPTLRREVIRTLPHILCVVVIFGMNEAVRANPELLQTLYVPGLVVSGAGILCAAVLWLWPMLRWRGAMPYDRWLGLTVVRRSRITPHAAVTAGVTETDPWERRPPP